MCLYPKLIINRKYLPNKKNKGKIPDITDPRVKYVPIGCGKCMECMKQKSMKWSIRLQEEIRHKKDGNFVTLSFSEESLNELDSEVQRINKAEHENVNKQTDRNTKYIEIEGYELENKMATLAVRRFLERWRKENKTSVRHWLVTELGHNNTERIHIHGIIFGDRKQIQKHWKYGNIWIGDYVNEQTVNYIVKYVNKQDTDHKYYNPIILCSSGIGNKYTERQDSKLNKYQGSDTKETYTTRQGKKIALPTYYRNKIYSDEEREKLWLNTLDKETRYINGIKIDVSKGEEDYENTLKYQRELNKKLGYGSRDINEKDKEYERQQRNIRRYTRQQKNKK
ncbi:MAG: replication initiator protein [Microviridae sp.]|nr:MAG: replication initiator protein [Microviridae sp.]